MKKQKPLTIVYGCDKSKAHSLLHQAIKRDEIIRPNRCSKCGEKGKIEGHHPDYSKPLQVIWLCSQCHRKYHAAYSNFNIGPKLPI